MRKVKADPKRLFRYIRKQQKVKATVGKLEMGNGGLTDTDQEAANVLQDFFQSVFVIEGDSCLPDFPNKLEEGEPLDIVKFTYDDILLELQALNEDSSTGLDDISTSVLKNCAQQLVPPLITMFTKSMEEGQLPTDWKNARITPDF